MKVKNLFAVALAGLAFTACNNDDALAPDNGPAAGKAYAAVSISINGTGTRASNGDDNAFAAENEIKSIWAWVNGNPIEIPLADINWNNGVGKATKAYEVIGKKDDVVPVWVVVNKVEPSGSQLNSSYFGNTLLATTYENLVGALTTTANGYTMFSKAAATATLQDTEADAILDANTAKVTVQRAAAKVLVKDSNKDYEHKSVDVTNGQGTIVAGSLKWYIGNSNRVLYCTPHDNNEDPNYIFVKKDWDEYYKDYVQLSDENGAWRDLTVDGIAGRAIDNLKDIAANSTTTETATINNVLYCNENTADDYKVSNTTYVLLEAQFTPKKLINANVGGTVDAPTATADGIIAGTDGQTFYLHQKSGVYFTAAGVDAYNAKFAKTGFGDFFTYTDAKCYYRINIKDGSTAAAQLGVLRNHYYSMAIGDISGLGSWTDPTNPVNPNIPDVEEPAEPEKAMVAVDITVEKWQTVDMGDVKPL
ncbi:Mfa1 family fimbria major subunit [Bacteroides sp.]|uniref:Mfa1 family fimbria major subunit n=1 Tax=Bacteroides sp. TaxID=29523 RepID=UPI002A80602F|nr:Mfa1 family fimbria major subunit [Bacteroides sp.]